MANVPSKEEVKKLRRQSYDANRRKAKSQEKQGKKFINYGQGVIPETIWKNLPGKKENG